MSRVEDWDVVLAEALEEARGRAFKWGFHDCATWAFDVRFRLTGLDAAAQWRGRYRGACGALRMLRRLGHRSVADLARAECGPEVPGLMARRGDLVLIGDALGVCMGAQVAVLSEAEGLMLRPLTEAVAAWRV